MKILYGIDAFEFCKEHNLLLTPDHRVVYNRYIPSVPQPFRHDPEQAATFVECSFDEVNNLCWEPFDTNPQGPGNMTPEEVRQEVISLMDKYGPALFSIVLESDDPLADEQLIFSCIEEMGERADGCSLVSSRDIFYHMRDRNKPLPPPPNALINYEGSALSESLDLLRDFEPWIYNICLRLRDKGILKTFPCDPYKPSQDFLENREGRCLFIPARLYEFIVEDARQAQKTAH
jgi:hypothetical protein